MVRPYRTQMDWGTTSPKMTGRVSLYRAGRWGRAGTRTDQNSAADNGRNASAETAIEHDGERLVDDDVGEEEGDEDPVLALAEQVEDLVGALAAEMRFVGVVLEDLEVDAVLAHEPAGAELLAVVRREEASCREGSGIGRRRETEQGRVGIDNIRNRQPSKGAARKHQHHG